MSTDRLADRHCEACNAETPPLEGEEMERYREMLEERWTLTSKNRLRASFDFSDFMGALDFTNRVGALAEEEGHHPEICLTWGRARVEIWTHVIDGLSENDFILAAKIDRMVEERGGA